MRSFSKEAAKALALAASDDRLSKLILLPKAKLSNSISKTVPRGRNRAVTGVEGKTPKSRSACVVTATKKMSHATKNQRADVFPRCQLINDNTIIAGADNAPKLTKLYAKSG